MTREVITSIGMNDAEREDLITAFSTHAERSGPQKVNTGSHTAPRELQILKTVVLFRLNRISLSSRKGVLFTRRIDASLPNGVITAASITRKRLYPWRNAVS